MYINNEEVFILKYDNDINKKICYFPLRGFLGLVTNSIAECITSNDNDVWTSLKEKLKSYPLLDMERVDELNTNRIPKLHLNLSEDCQLRCKYCYLSTENSIKETMSLKKAKSIVDAYLNYLSNHKLPEVINISFFGGAEPTYNENLFMNIVEYTKSRIMEMGCKYSFGMTTNGYYSSELMSFILSNFSRLTYSLDGPKILHDKHRVTSEGKGSFDIVYSNAKLLYSSNLNYTFRLTLTKLSIPMWKDIIDFFEKEFPGCDLMVSPMIPIGRGETYSHMAIDKSCINDYKQSVINMYEYAKDKSINLKIPNVLRPKSMKIRYCGAANGSLWIVSNDNKIKMCSHSGHDEEFTIGEFDNETKQLIVTEEKITFIQNKYNVTNYKTKCKECYCKYTCIGGCPSNRYNKLNYLYCDTTKELTRKLMCDIIDKNRNI